MKNPATIDIKSSIFDAIRKMREEKIGRLLVSENEKISKIITEKDIGLFLFKDASERKLDEISLRELSTPVLSVDESTKIQECAKIMLEKAIGSLAIKSDNKIVGIITKTDLVKYFAKNHVGKKVVGEYMSPYYSWVYSDTPLSRVILKMLDEKISRIILRNRDEYPVGILSFGDLLRSALTLGEETTVLDSTDPAISVIFPKKGFLSESGYGGSTIASEIMKDEIITVSYDDDLAETCKILLENEINGVGVLSSNGSLIGILSKTDIVKAIAFLN